MSEKLHPRKCSWEELPEPLTCTKMCKHADTCEDHNLRLKAAHQPTGDDRIDIKIIAEIDEKPHQILSVILNPEFFKDAPEKCIDSITEKISTDLHRLLRLYTDGEYVQGNWPIIVPPQLKKKLEKLVWEDKKD